MALWNKDYISQHPLHLSIVCEKVMANFLECFKKCFMCERMTTDHHKQISQEEVLVHASHSGVYISAL